MPRKKLYKTSDWPYFITNRTNNREWFQVPMSRLWRVFGACLRRTSAHYGTEIHAFVLMSNHYHLVVSTPRKNIDEAMRYFQTEVAKKILKLSHRENHVFGTRYHWSVLEGNLAVAYAYKYLARNPVRAGITSAVEAYPYWASSSKACPHFPLVSSLARGWDCVPKSPHAQWNWLNQPTPKEADELVRKALRRRQFGFSSCHNARKLVREVPKAYGVGAFELAR